MRRTSSCLIVLWLLGLVSGRTPVECSFTSSWCWPSGDSHSRDQRPGGPSDDLCPHRCAGSTIRSGCSGTLVVLALLAFALDPLFAGWDESYAASVPRPALAIPAQPDSTLEPRAMDRPTRRTSIAIGFIRAPSRRNIRVRLLQSELGFFVAFSWGSPRWRACNLVHCRSSSSRSPRTLMVGGDSGGAMRMRSTSFTPDGVEFLVPPCRPALRHPCYRIATTEDTSWSSTSLLNPCPAARDRARRRPCGSKRAWQRSSAIWPTTSG